MFALSRMATLLMSWNEVRYMRADAPEKRGLLFLRPKADPQPLCVKATPGLKLFVQDWTIQNGFVPVKLPHQPGSLWVGKTFWVPACNILAIWRQHWHWTPLTEAMWWESVWTLKRSDFRIRVSHGYKDELQGIDFMVYQKVIGDVVHEEYKNYTYCALEIGRPVRRVCHVTLGYLPICTFEEQVNIATALQHILWRYFAVTNENRPAELMLPYLRKCLRKTPEEVGYDVGSIEALVDMTAEDIHDLFRSGRLELYSASPGILANEEKHLQELLKMHARDTGRYAAACARAALLPEDSEVQKEEVHQAVFEDLMHYLTDRLRHLREAYITAPCGKLLPPRILWPHQWHISRQDDWKLSERNYVQEGMMRTSKFRKLEFG